jgi:hypothetical protein
VYVLHGMFVACNLICGVDYAWGCEAHDLWHEKKEKALPVPKGRPYFRLLCSAWVLLESLLMWVRLTG